jgi:hypothetical protein
MIHGFPIPYPDELFYSLVARRLARLDYPHHRAVLREVFGTNIIAGTLELPCRLAWLQHALPDEHPCRNESLLFETTMLSWYAPFLPTERLAELKHHMLYGEGRLSWARPGILSRGVPPLLYLRFCPTCLRDDKSEGRDSYWRRLHQIAGIDVCPRHKVYLEESQIPRPDNGAGMNFVTPPQALLNVASRTSRSAYLERLATLAETLLSGAIKSIEADRRYAAYRNALESARCLTAQFLVRTRELANRLAETFPDEYLVTVNCSVSTTAACPWFIRPTLKRRSTFAPLKHLLVMCALNMEWHDFMTANHEGDSRRKAASKPCGNPVCPERGKSWPLWSACSHGCRFKLRVNHFKCGACGRVTAECKDSKRMEWVRDRGPVWRAELAKLWNDQTQNLYEIAERLEVSSTIVKRHAWKMGLIFPRRGPSVAIVSRGLKVDSKTLPLKDWRRQWLREIEAHPGYGVKRLRRTLPNLYARLYRWDRDWFLKHSPREKGSRQRKSIVDWEERDTTFSRILLAGAAKAIRSRPPERVTARTICRLAGIHHRLVLKSLRLLPQCRSILAENTETSTDFASRLMLLAQEGAPAGIYSKVMGTVEASASRSWSTKLPSISKGSS